MSHLTTIEAAARLRVKPQTLRAWRVRGGGPGPYLRVSRNRVIYPLESIEAWERSRLAHSTAEETVGRRPAA